MNTAIVSTKTFRGKKLVFWSFKDTKSLRENSDMINFIKAKSRKPLLAAPKGRAALYIKPDQNGLNKQFPFLAGLSEIHDDGI